jgi:hypothetical protein
MGYSPAAIGLSYVPQTIAFLVGTAAARGAAKMGRSADAAWLLVLYALSVIGTWAVGLFRARVWLKF